MSSSRKITAKSKRILWTAFAFSTVTSLVGCAGGTYNNAPGYSGYPYPVQPGQYPATLPYNGAPQLPVPQGNVLPQSNVLPQGALSPQVNANAPAGNIAGSTALPYGYPIGTAPQAVGTLPANAYQPGAYTASNPYPNTDASAQPMIRLR